MGCGWRRRVANDELRCDHWRRAPGVTWLWMMEDAAFGDELRLKDEATGDELRRGAWTTQNAAAGDDLRHEARGVEGVATNDDASVLSSLYLDMIP
uniref:Uncharacterized protein n=1 Tax=Oryza sativa subsp. japonica TaxID=39947 RepID=Q6ZKH4_ORYSJ|nr:hypothetical protein [Oryza sativa Japonica Group]